ncbi:DUF2231 domain-containing protein [Novosphingobium sp. YAF33]
MLSAQPAVRPIRPLRRSLHPLHALLMAFPVALFPSALLSDVTYVKTAQIQWTNFSAWLITGALLLGGFALLWSAIATWAARERVERRHNGVVTVLLALAWIAGLFNAFQHSHDGWASVGTMGVVLSVLSTILALAAGWVGHSQGRVLAVEAGR